MRPSGSDKFITFDVRKMNSVLEQKQDGAVSNFFGIQNEMLLLLSAGRVNNINYDMLQNLKPASPHCFKFFL